MSMSALTRSPTILAAVLALAGCGSSEPGGGEGASLDMAEPATRTTTRSSEWSVGGIVSGRTERTTTEPVPGPPVVVERPALAERRAVPQSGLLTAGDIDDVLNPDQYAAYAGRFLQAGGAALPFVDARTRVVIRVVDSAGAAVPFARVSVSREGAPLRLATAADGTTAFYPRMDKVAQQATVTVNAPAGAASRTVKLAGERAVTLTLPGRSAAPAAIDLALVIDTTGSMGDEMAYLRAELDTIVARLKRNAGNLDLRIGVILYRDLGDDYVVRSTPLTGDVGAVRALLGEQEAEGGGDPPEAMDQAMVAAGRLQWRANAAKAVLLVTDAPPHAEHVAGTIQAAQRLRERGVQVVPVAASGVEDSAQFVLRTAAVLTQGRYIFLTDDSGVGDAHAEPDVACYVVTHLDQLVARVLAGIATGQRIEARPEDVVRTVGDYRAGRCGRPAQS